MHDDTFYGVHAVITGLLGGLAAGLVHSTIDNGWLVFLAMMVVVIAGSFVYFRAQEMRNKGRKE